MRLRIREIRLQKGMTLRELGEQIGRQPNSVWEYEMHKSRIPASVLYDIAQVLGVSIAELCSNDDPPVTAAPARAPRRRATRAKY